MQTVLDSLLASFLDLVLLTEEPGFEWSPTELRAAFQWASTLQQLVASQGGLAAVRQRLADLQHQLPPALQPVVPAISSRPLQLALECLLRRPANNPQQWMEAVLAAYLAAVVLPSPPDQQPAAEQQLLSTLGSLQQAAAVHSIALGAAKQAATAAMASLQGRDCYKDTQSAQLAEEALRFMTSPDCLEAAAVAQLLAGRMQQCTSAAPQALGDLLHSPPTQVELELLCMLVLKPHWEAVIGRLAHGSNSSNGAPYSASGSSPVGTAAAQQAVKLLCTACSSQPEAVLQQHPALLAEVCRQSFRFTCSYAALLAKHQREAAEGTRSASEAAQWRVAHAAKHQDHVTDYVLQVANCHSASNPQELWQ